MGHHHDHSSSKNLKTAFFLNFGFTIFEIIGGFYVNSVSIISDAVHDLGDSISLGLAWYLDKKSKQESNHKFSFGYSRFSLLGALINSLVLISGSIYVIYEAINRLIYPEYSDADGMIILAIIGVAVNGYAAYKLSGAKTLNEKVVSWHLIEDVLGWVAVLIVAIVLKFKNTPYLDPALSLFITAYILWNVFKRLKETLILFLQAVPEGVSISQIEELLLNINQVESIHHTHIWSQDGEKHVFSTHLKLKNTKDLTELIHLKKEVKRLLKPFHFQYCTIETEISDEDCSFEKEG